MVTMPFLATSPKGWTLWTKFSKAIALILLKLLTVSRTSRNSELAVRGSRESGVGSRKIPTVETGGLIQNALIVRGLNARLQAGIFSFPYLKKGACSLSES